MKIKSLLPISLLALSSISPTASADNSNMSAAQKKAIEQVVHDYLLKNPDVLVEVSQALQQKQQQVMQQQALTAISSNADQLFNDKMTLSGNHTGNVTLVEFFDYQCVHCKKMTPIVADLMKKNANLRVIYKEFPIFGDTSAMASKAALAASMQNKYLAMHEALIKQNQRLTADIIDKAAKSVGLNMTKFKTDMASKEIADALTANRQLAEQLHLMGTPAFIVAATPGGKFKQGSEPAFIPGAATEEVLQDLIKKFA